MFEFKQILLAVLMNTNKPINIELTQTPLKIQPVIIQYSKDSLGIRIAKKATLQMNNTGYLAFSANTNHN